MFQASDNANDEGLHLEHPSSGHRALHVQMCLVFFSWRLDTVGAVGSCSVFKDVK